jgi:hypothetical protein
MSRNPKESATNGIPMEMDDGLRDAYRALADGQPALSDLPGRVRKTVHKRRVRRFAAAGSTAAIVVPAVLIIALAGGGQSEGGQQVIVSTPGPTAASETPTATATPKVAVTQSPSPAVTESPTPAGLVTPGGQAVSPPVASVTSTGLSQAVPATPTTAASSQAQQPTTSPSPAATPNNHDTQVCSPEQLQLSAHYLQGAGGDEFYVVDLHNVSADTCGLNGYAGITLLDSAGHLTTATEASYGKPLSRVTIAPDGYASTFLHAHPNACDGGHPPNSRTMNLYPDGNSDGVLIIAFAVPECLNSVEPLQPGPQPSSD